jgi:hypothetical protein
MSHPSRRARICEAETRHLARDEAYTGRLAIGEFDTPRFERGLELTLRGGMPARMAILEARADFAEKTVVLK